MTDMISASPKRPGIVIFVAILHFLSASLFMFLSLFCVLSMFFGTALGIDTFFTQQMTHYAPAANFSYGLTLIFGAALFVFLCFFSFFLSVGIGLLRAKKFAWYLQVAFSTLGLLSLPLGFMWSLFVLPIGSIFNIVVLVFFFQPHIRNYFKV